MNIIFAAFLIALDQITKYAVRIRLKPVYNIDIIPGWFSLTYVENRGAAFGILKEKKIFLVGLTALVIIVMILYIIKNKNLGMKYRMALLFIISGAIGNLIDRVAKSFVTDMFHFYVGNRFDFPVFNLADVYVVCGTIFLTLCLIFSKDIQG